MRYNARVINIIKEANSIEIKQTTGKKGKIMNRRTNLIIGLSRVNWSSYHVYR